MADKRKIDRREFTYYMQVSDDITKQLIGYLTDISTGGFKLDSPKEIPSGHDFRMHIDLTADIADKNSMVFIARSKWCRRDHIDPNTYNIGFEIINMAAKVAGKEDEGARGKTVVIERRKVEKPKTSPKAPPPSRERLYRVKEELIRGRLIESVVAAVIYAICRLQGIPRTLDEISRASGIEKKEIGRAYRFLKTELKVDVPLTDPAQYVPKFATALKLGGEVQEEAVKLIRKALRKGLISGRGPTGVAAAAPYIASAMHGEKKTQKEVADVAGVTEVT